jgi:DNA-binding transcriptional LysR family regulator
MGRISIAQLEAFYWVAELEAVHKAANKLNITQPTVSLRLRQLEAELDTPVLEPHGRGVRVTLAGHAFLAKTKLVLDAYAHLQSGASPSAISGPLRIGLAEGFAVACLLHLVPALASAYPLLRPEWTVTTSSALEQDLVDGKLDLAVVVDPVGDRALRLLPLGAQPNVWAGSPALSVRAGASPRELTCLTIITTPPPTPVYRNTVAWFAAGGQKPGPLCICTSVNAAAQLAAAGIGIGIFPTRMIEASHLAGRIAAIATDPPLQIGRVYMADHVTADQSRTEALMRVLEEVTRELNYFGPPG